MDYVTIDTGLNGAMVGFKNGKPMEGLTFQRLGLGIASHPILELLEKWQPSTIYIEGIPAMPKQSVKSTATQWFVFGQCFTLAEMHSERLEIVPAIRWAGFTKRLSATPNNPSKAIAQELVNKFYADFAEPYRLRRYKGVRKVHDGIADCLCLNMYVQRDIFVDHLHEAL